MPDKVIKFSELKAAINMIFDHIEQEMGSDSITLKHDYYHDISMFAGDALDIMNDRPCVVIGSLYDDWEFLENMIQDDSACHPMFEKVGNLLRYIASAGYEELYKKTGKERS